MLCINNNLIEYLSFARTQLNDKTVLFLTIQFSISHLFAFSLNVKQFYQIHSWNSICCCHSGPEWAWERWLWRLLRIPPSSSNTEPSSWDCLVSYTGHSLGKSYPSAEIQSVYSTAPSGWAAMQFCVICRTIVSGDSLTHLQRCYRYILQAPGRLGWNAVLCHIRTVVISVVCVWGSFSITCASPSDCLMSYAGQRCSRCIQLAPSRLCYFLPFLLLWPRKGSLMKTQTRILDNITQER